ncbi:MAG: glyoxylate/hydroxypyruvate reductase A [Rhizobiaceae bacterium]|nr:glyoxylate/hydroxypyruvate reductase A [Rhizobiaceae bacterium]
MKSGLLIDVKFDSFGKFEPFRELMPGREIISWRDENNRPTDLGGIHYALGWKPDAGLFASMPDLKVMFSVGAGVDHILCDPTLPDLPLVRFVDAGLTSRMSEWVCLQCLMHLRQQRTYDKQQSERIWRDHKQPDASDLRVGIMGMGVLGCNSARKLKALGFRVNGWSRSRKEIDGVSCYEGAQLDEFLGNSDIIVGLLPLTPQTTGIFNSALFAKLPRETPIGGPVFINAGRGKSQVEADIVSALETGVLGGISLDVFENEPLDSDSALWVMDNAILTPHVASVSDADALARHVAGQIERFEAGLELQHLVDMQVGY